MYEEDNIESEFLKRGKKNLFRTPDGYFDSIEDRIMEKITHSKNTKTTSNRIVKFIKPAFALAASLLLVGLLVYSPVKTLLINDSAKSEVAQSSPTDLLDNDSFDLGSIDENTLATAIFTDETSDVSVENSDELLAYLSSGLNDIEIYSEIQNY